MSSHFGISGLSTAKNIRTAQVGVAGLDSSGLKGAKNAAGLDGAAAVAQRDQVLGDLARDSQLLGDRAARQAWRNGVWFADFTYIATPYESNGRGYVSSPMRWREGREVVFGRQHRVLPLFIDSCGYRREITGTAPQWAMNFNAYPQAIELLQPDGYAAWDYPTDRARSMVTLHELMSLFPDDDRLWPVFSARWTWNDNAHLSFARLPGWAGRNLASLIPQNRTQKLFKADTREGWARQAIANALVMAADPDFRWMVEKFGRVMIGGLVGSDCPRTARHLLAAVLCELFPDAQFWMLGQANFAVVNGLGAMGLIDRVWTDGTWFIKDAVCSRFAMVEDGLLTMLSLESGRKGNGMKWHAETFFTLTEMMAANLRSLLAAYEGLWTWPPPEPLPVDLLDVEQLKELKSRYQAAQLELGL